MSSGSCELAPAALRGLPPLHACPSCCPCSVAPALHPAPGHHGGEREGARAQPREPSGGGSQPASPLVIPGETLPCPAAHLLPWQWDDGDSAAVAISIFQLSQEAQGSNIYTLAFCSERTSNQNNEGSVLSDGVSRLPPPAPLNNCYAIGKPSPVALYVTMGGMRNECMFKSCSWVIATPATLL